MMTPDNLSTCFGPNLLRPQGDFKSAYEPLACNQVNNKKKNSNNNNNNPRIVIIVMSMLLIERIDGS